MELRRLFFLDFPLRLAIATHMSGQQDEGRQEDGVFEFKGYYLVDMGNSQ